MGKHILIIEPSRTIRTLLDIHFNNEAHAVMLFDDYKSALQRLMQPALQHYPPDLAFIALHQDRPESVAALSWVGQSSFYVDVLLVALVAQEEVTYKQLQRAIQAAKAHLLIKPFRIQDALALVMVPSSRGRSCACPANPSCSLGTEEHTGQAQGLPLLIYGNKLGESK